MPSIDPVNKTIDELWALFLADSDFVALVKAANTIQYNSETDDNQVKATLSFADLPEVAIIYTGGDCNINESSSSSKLFANFQVLINTGENRLTVLATKLSWLTLCKITSWRTQLAALTWYGQGFIKAIRMPTVTVGESNPQRNRNINGWVVMWNVQMEMHFRTTQLTVGEP